jgi:hypothetical protein
MRSRTLHPLITLLVCCGFFLASAPVSQPRAVLAEPASAAPADVGDVTPLVTDGVTSFALASEKVFWHLNPVCRRASSDPAVINRIPGRGGAVRQIFAREDPRGLSICNPYRIISNIVADDDYLYWVDRSGLVRLSANANPGDQPELLNPNVAADYVELAISTDRIYGLSGGNIWGIDKSGPGPGFSIYFSADPPANLSFDGQYLYFLANGALRRATPAGDLLTLATNVSAYYATGLIKVTCSPFEPFCGDTDRVFYAQNNIIRFYNNRSSTTSDVFKEEPAGVQIGKLYADNNRVFAYETRFVSCSPAPCSGGSSFDSLYRIPIKYGVIVGYYGGPSELLTERSRTAASLDITTPLRSDGLFLYWQEDNLVIKRIYADAAEVPVVSLIFAEPVMEITQAVQDQTNSVPLIQNRRTFVRVFVRSESGPVPGVTALLYGSGSGLAAQALAPINKVGLITVDPSPNRNDIDDSFLFALPLEWTRVPNLQLSARINPYGVPPESNYADNVSRVFPVTFNPSGRLSVSLVKFRYRAGPPDKQTWYEPSAADVNAINAQIRGMYPLASAAGYANDPSPGFRPRLYSVQDDGLSGRIDYNKAPDCQYLLTPKRDKDGKIVYQNGKAVMIDNRNLCPTYYVNDRLAALRSEWGLGGDEFMYGLISPLGGPQPPRGVASGHNTASGASDRPFTAAHEIGHVVGQQHPFAGSKYDTNQCGNTIDDGAIDSNYPYPNGQIGPSDGTVNGFDPGSSLFVSGSLGGTGAGGLTIYSGLAVKAGASNYDIMSYCYPTAPWISKYTYTCMFRTLRDGSRPSDCFRNYTPPSAAQSLQSAQYPSPSYRLSAQPLPGDWLHVIGVIGGDGHTAAVNYIRRVGSVMGVPPRQPGSYSVHLLDAQGRLLAEYPFTPSMAHHASGAMSFEIVEPFVAGTAEVRIVTATAAGLSSAAFVCTLGVGSTQAAGAVLARVPVSAHPPAVSNVALTNPPNPVAGNVTLGWNASDPDGGPLSFDLFYSHNGGASFLPLQSGVSGSSATIDAAQIGGGSVIFRVVASDGVQTTHADSQSYAVANQPPQPVILAPGDGGHVRWGQVVTLSGEATDAQDGGVTSDQLVWGTQHGTLGSGAELSVQLPAGPNRVTLTATNSAGLSASTTLTVYVDDDVRAPGPTLSVAPAQVSWHIPPGASAPQTAQLAVSNAGGGMLSWTASSDASWLTLDVGSGTGPATLTLSADPSGAAEGTTAHATVTLTRVGPAGQAAETLTVPVSMSVGNVVSPPHIQSPRPLYLPIVRR